MAELYFDADAARRLESLETANDRQRLLARVNAILDSLEVDPGRSDLRRRRFQNGLWCVTAAGDGENWVLLWEPHPNRQDVVVQYLGPASFE